MSVATEITRLHTAKADIKTAIEKKGVTIQETELLNEYSSKIDEVYEAGKKAQHDAFWDIYQDNGNRTDYSFAFGGAGWTPETFKPKYNIIIAGVSGNSAFKRSKIGNLKQILEDLGKELDFSGCTNFSETFGQPGITHIGVVDTRNANNITSLCVWNSALIEIKKLILKDDGSQTSLNAFVGTSKLETLFIEGVIGNDFLVQSNVLNRASIESIVNHLSDEKGATLTLRKLAVNKAFNINVDDPTTYPEGSEYYTLRNSKSNWTFNYA